MDHATADLIEKTSELTARRIVEPMWKDIRKLNTTVDRVEATLLGPNQEGGLLGDVAGIKTELQIRKIDCDQKHLGLNEVMKEPQQAVSRWGWMFAGSAGTIVGLGIILAILREWMRKP